MPFALEHKRSRHGARQNRIFARFAKIVTLELGRFLALTWPSKFRQLPSDPAFQLLKLLYDRSRL